MASTIVVPDPQLIGAYPQKIVEQLYAVATAASTDLSALQTFSLKPVRCVIATNIASLASVTVASRDGLTLVAGDRVLLVNQTTAAQNGVYVVGTVATGSAPFTRATDFAAAAAIVNGMTVEASEGTLWAGSSWKAMCTGACVVATDDPKFYPQHLHRTVTLVAGAYAFGVADQLMLFSTTKAQVSITRNTANTSTLTTGGYTAPVAQRTAGLSGTAALGIQAEVAAGTLNNADVSTLDVLITNW